MAWYITSLPLRHWESSESRKMSVVSVKEKYTDRHNCAASAPHCQRPKQTIYRWRIKSCKFYSHSGNYEGHFTGLRDILWQETTKISKGQLDQVRENKDVNSKTEIILVLKSLKHFLFYWEILMGGRGSWFVENILRVENIPVRSAVDANGLLFNNSCWWGIKHFWFYSDRHNRFMCRAHKLW